MRHCQVCKDVARECPEGINCKFLTRSIEAHMLGHVTGSDEAEQANEVFRFIKDLASNENIRAKQVMDTNLKPTEQRVLFFVRRHAEILKKLGFLQQKLMESKSLVQVQAEVPLFLKEIKADSEKPDVAKLVDLFKMLEAYQPFLVKAREAAAEAAAEKKQKADMHGDSTIVEKFLENYKFKGDRTFARAFILMSMK